MISIINNGKLEQLLLLKLEETSNNSTVPSGN